MDLLHPHPKGPDNSRKRWSLLRPLWSYSCDGLQWWTITCLMFLGCTPRTYYGRDEPTVPHGNRSTQVTRLRQPRDSPPPRAILCQGNPLVLLWALLSEEREAVLLKPEEKTDCEDETLRATGNCNNIKGLFICSYKRGNALLTKLVLYLFTNLCFTPQGIFPACLICSPFFLLPFWPHQHPFDAWAILRLISVLFLQ